MFTRPGHRGRQRTQKKFVGTLAKQHGQWVVLPDGNALTEPILAPDAASRHFKVGTKVVIELTTYPGESGERPKGVITEVLGEAGEKDVDLKSVIVQFNLPGISG
jgi:ribonuclease R